MRRYQAAIAALALFLIATGSFTFSNRVPPDQAAGANRIIVFGDNADNSSGFMKYGQRETGDTTGATADQQGVGEAIPVNVRCVAPYISVAGPDVGAQSCTLKVWTTTHAGTGTTLRFQHIWTSPGLESLSDSTFDMDAGDVMVVYANSDGAGLKSPHFYFPVAPR